MSQRLCLAAAIVTSALPASAQPGASGTDLPPPKSDPALAQKPAGQSNSWYGWQILAADALALGLGITVTRSYESEDFEHRMGRATATAWSIGMLTSMTIHSVHHRPPLGFASWGTRMGVPLLSTVIGMGGTCLAKQQSTCASEGATWGFASGLGVAIATDALLFSRKRSLFDQFETRHFYGIPTLFIDGGGLALGGLIVFTGDLKDGNGKPYTTSDKVFILTSMHYTASVLGAPWVHVANGNGLRALGSFGIRAVGPPAGMLMGLLGYCAATGGTDGCIKTGAAFGFLGGSLIASAIDITLLSWDEPSMKPYSGDTGPRVAPYLAPTEGGFSLGLTASN